MPNFMIQCPHCRQELEIDQDPSGMELECPVCRKHFIVAAEAAGEAAEPQQDALHRQLIEKIGNEARNWVFQEKSIPALRQMLSELDQHADEPELTEIRQQFVRRVYHYAVSQETEKPDLAVELLDCIPGLSEAGDLRQAIVLRKMQDQKKQDSLKRKRLIIAAGGVIIAAVILVGVMVFCRVTIGAYLGIASCQLSIGEKLAAAGKKSEAFEWYRKAAERGNAKGQFLLGECLKKGLGVKKDEDEAVNWYRKAAEQGNADAQFMLGFCYEYGRGVPRDIAEAVKWYRKAAEQGNADGQFSLGFCYNLGRGVTQDYPEAVRWYRKAAVQGHAFSQFQLAVCYCFGKGVTSDKAEAIKWFRKAAKDDGKIGEAARKLLRELE